MTDVLVYYLILMAFGLLIFYIEIKDRRKYSQGKNNRIYSKDGMRVTYVYSIPHTKERVMEILSHKNAQDQMIYNFDSQSMEIGFKDLDNEFYHRSSIEARYRMRFEEKEDSCLLYLEQINIFYTERHVLARMNAFWVLKVDAVPYEIN